MSEIKLRDARIDIFVGSSETMINVYDNTANIRFLEITLTSQQLSEALSRLAHTKCSATVYGHEHIGKIREIKPLEFPLSKQQCDYHDRSKEASSDAKIYAEKGWSPDCYFGSQNSFFTKDGKTWARCHQMRWVDGVEKTPAQGIQEPKHKGER